MVLGHDLQAPLGVRQRECACEQTFFFLYPVHVRK